MPGIDGGAPASSTPSLFMQRSVDCIILSSGRNKLDRIARFDSRRWSGKNLVWPLAHEKNIVRVWNHYVSNYMFNFKDYKKARVMQFEGLIFGVIKGVKAFEWPEFR
jgi:hypothetical protein